MEFVWNLWSIIEEFHYQQEKQEATYHQIFWSEFFEFFSKILTWILAAKADDLLLGLTLLWYVVKIKSFLKTFCLLM